MNHSKVEFHSDHHHQQQHNTVMECPRQYRHEICCPKAFAPTHTEPTMMLKGEMISASNEDFLLNVNGNCMNSSFPTKLQDDSMDQDDLDAPTTRPSPEMAEIEVKSSNPESNFKSTFSTEKAKMMDSYTPKSLPNTSNDWLQATLMDSQAIHNRLDQFLQKYTKPNQRAKTPQPQEHQNHGYTNPVPRRVSTNDMELGINHYELKHPASQVTKNHESKSSTRDRNDSFSHFLDQKMPAQWIVEDEVIIERTAGVGITTPSSMTAGFPTCTDAPASPRHMASSLCDHPHRISVLDRSDSVQKSIVSLEEERASGNYGEEEMQVNHDEDHSFIDLIQPLPFVTPPRMVGKQARTTRDLQEASHEHLDQTPSASMMDDSFSSLGNLFGMEDLSQDLFSTSNSHDRFPQKRSFDAKEDAEDDLMMLSRPWKRFKVCQETVRDLSRDGILSLDQIVLAPLIEPSSTAAAVAKKPPAAKPKKRTSVDRSIEFTKMYQQCLVFSETHGHCAIPTKFPANPDLADWAKKIRNAYARIAKGTKSRLLSQEQIQELDKIGFCWNLKEHDWNTTFGSLQEQVRMYGVAGGSHTKWLNSQRKKLAKNQLRLDQAQKIASLNFRPMITSFYSA